MIKLYANEQFPLDVVIELRKFGYDVLTTHDVSKSGKGIADTEVLSFAISLERAVITFDKDFFKLHRDNPNHCGIILCTENRNYLQLAQIIHTKLSQICILSKFGGKKNLTNSIQLIVSY
jgi:predicted nuclease of predicted toxin-antitoxin system